MRHMKNFFTVIFLIALGAGVYIYVQNKAGIDTPFTEQTESEKEVGKIEKCRSDKGNVYAIYPNARDAGISYIVGGEQFDCKKSWGYEGHHCQNIPDTYLCEVIYASKGNSFGEVPICQAK